MRTGETSARQASVDTQWTSQRFCGWRCGWLNACSLLSLWQYRCHRQSHGVNWKT